MTSTLTEETRRTAKALADAFLAGDFETAMSYFDHDVVLHEAESLPYGGDHAGIDAMGAALMQILASAEVLAVEHQYVDGDTVINMGRIRMRSTGREVRVAEIWRFANGKVVEMTPFYWDTAAIIEDLAKSDA